MEVAGRTFHASWRWMTSNRPMVLVALAALYIAQQRIGDPDFGGYLRWEARECKDFWNRRYHLDSQTPEPIACIIEKSPGEPCNFGQ